MLDHYPMRRHWTSSILLALWLAQGLGAQEIGPARGSLVIVGGAMRDETIMKRFITLAGGPGARIVVIPTAGADEDYDDFYPGVGRWRGLGAEATVLHTRDRNVANSEAFTEPIRQATGVWFPGGRPQRLSDVYLGTCIERELHTLLERGGVIGGSSAGASIQGSYLVRGDSETNRIVMGDHVKGFGLLRNVAIDQHLITRNRHFDLIPVIEKHPELLGIGIDEDTAIVVRGDTFEVIGQSVVAIYDNTRLLADGGRFYFLRPGDTFDLAKREAKRRAFAAEPFAVVRDEPWPDRN